MNFIRFEEYKVFVGCSGALVKSYISTFDYKYDWMLYFQVSCITACNSLVHKDCKTRDGCNLNKKYCPYKPKKKTVSLG